jgi:ubiquinone/menaquinone biosynthesis C-methylase UbiE
MFRVSPALCFLLPGFLFAQSLHPVTGRPLPTLGSEGQDQVARRQQSMTETANTVLDLIGIQAGAWVGDVASGNGEFSWRLAERVGSAGKVFAVDTTPDVLDRIRKTITAHGLSNVKVSRGGEQDPKLPAAKLDLVLLAGAYHGFTHPQDMVRKIRESLKPDGKLVVIEYRKEDDSIAVPGGQRMSIREIRGEIEPEGYKFDKVVGVLPREHIVIFTKSH